MTDVSWKYLFKVGVFSLILGIVSMILSYGFVYTMEWIEGGGLSELKEKIKAKKEAKKASKYVTKTIESR